jgi:hypothetical protein
MSNDERSSNDESRDAVFVIRASTFDIALGFALGFAQPGYSVALFPLTAFLEQFDALKSF